ncbi:MAG: hypothetical protein FJ387_04545 [Verrucomicrobia bacterium]|nr:hypothetical protein [Verrucomicrobiota bacterium]
MAIEPERSGPGRSGSRATAGWILASLLALVAGCRHPGAGFYPVGVYGVRDTNQLPVLRAAGFNLVQGPATTPFLDAARAAGLRVLASPGTSAGPHFRAAVSRYDGHPALWAWYVVDEPDLNQVPPGQVQAAHAYFKRIGARKPTALALMQGYESFHYANITDITMLDRYPVPWLPLANFGQHLRQARLALGPRKPLVAVLQTFDWSLYPELMSERRDDFRPPTYAELRCMAYGALVERATGLFFYAYDDGRWRLSEHPTAWQAVQAVVEEVNQRTPLFLAEHLWWPKRFVYEDPARRFNAALSSSVELVWLRVRSGSAIVPAGEYILGVNTTAEAHRLHFALPRPTDLPIPVLAEERELAPDQGRVTDEFPPYGVRVYGPLPAGTPAR